VFAANKVAADVLVLAVVQRAEEQIIDSRVTVARYANPAPFSHERCDDASAGIRLPRSRGTLNHQTTIIKIKHRTHGVFKR